MEFYLEIWRISLKKELVIMEIEYIYFLYKKLKNDFY